MVQTEELKEKIELSGMKYSAIAEKLGISRTSLWKKVGGQVEFKVSEMVGLASLIGLSQDEQKRIFFLI